MSEQEVKAMIAQLKAEQQLTRLETRKLGAGVEILISSLSDLRDVIIKLAFSMEDQTKATDRLERTTQQMQPLTKTD